MEEIDANTDKTDIAEDDEQMPELIPVSREATKVVPVTILTGFLGSGKTTLLNHLLTANHGKRLAVIENEFSAGLGIEGMIAKSGVDGKSLEGFFELNNGCICCTVKDDLLTTLEQLVLHKDRFDYVIIETTGVANPGPVISTFWTDDQLGSTLRLDGVVCVIDSVNIQRYLLSEDTAFDVRMQMCYADRILLNKSDLVTTEQVGPYYIIFMVISTVKAYLIRIYLLVTAQLDAAEKAVRCINGIAELRHTSFGNVGPQWVLDIDCYATKTLINFDFLFGQGLISGDMCVPCLPPSREAEPQSQEGPTDALDARSLQLNPSISTGISSALASAVARKHSPNSMSTHAIKFPGDLDLRALHRFLDAILYDEQSQSSSISTAHGAVPSPSSENAPICRRMQIFRMKGILHVSGSQYLHVLQAVHEIFDTQPSSFTRHSPEDTTQGLNRIIVIGKALDVEALEGGFRSAISSAD